MSRTMQTTDPVFESHREVFTQHYGRLCKLGAIILSPHYAVLDQLRCEIHPYETCLLSEEPYNGSPQFTTMGICRECGEVSYQCGTPRDHPSFGPCSCSTFGIYKALCWNCYVASLIPADGMDSVFTEHEIPDDFTFCLDCSKLNNQILFVCGFRDAGTGRLTKSAN